MKMFLNINRVRQRNASWLFALMIVFFGCGKHGSQPNAQTISPDTTSDQGWVSLFDGETSNGWRGVNRETFPADGWEIADGMLMTQAAGGEESASGGDIITVDAFRNFIFECEWNMTTKGGNSGVKYFVKEELSDNQKHGVGLEYQILDDENFSWMLEGKMQPGDYRTLASLYEIYPAKNKSAKPPGEWNRSRIVAKGKHVEHWLNDVKVLEYERGSDDFRRKVSESKFAGYKNFGEATEGHILLQDHGSEIAFRNIRIKALP